jgi:hypothetical protein
MSTLSKSLRNLPALTAKRDSLIGELKKIETAIVSALSGKGQEEAPAKKRGPKPKAAKVVAVKAAAPKKAKEVKAVKPKAAKAAAGAGRGKRGALKEQILAALKSAGAKGVSVKDLSDKLGVKTQNVHVWFSTTGKTVGVEKVSPGVYRLK